MGRRGRITRYDNKARTRETEDAKHWRDGTQKGGRREDKEPYAKPKGRCGGLGVSRPGPSKDAPN